MATYLDDSYGKLAGFYKGAVEQTAKMYNDDKLYKDLLGELTNPTDEEIIKNNHNINHKRMYNVAFLNRFKVKYPNELLRTPIAYIFMTRPDLNILENNIITPDADKVPELYQAYADYKYLLYGVTHNNGVGFVRSPFINVNTNYAENFTTQDIVMKTKTYGETFLGYKMELPENSIESTSTGSFSIKYVDNRNLEVYRTNKVWFDYIKNVKLGRVKPRDKHKKAGVIDFESTLFYFLLAEDGMTIKHCAKYYGVYPTNIPDSVFSWSRSDSGSKKMEFDIEYHYDSFESHDFYTICSEFNLTAGTDPAFYDIYNEEVYALGTTWVHNAHINKHGDKYLLRFS